MRQALARLVPVDDKLSMYWLTTCRSETMVQGTQSPKRWQQAVKEQDMVLHSGTSTTGTHAHVDIMICQV
jgi:hypothetical protein